MKKIKNIHYALFALVFVAKLYHIHYHTIALLAIAFSYLLVIIIGAIRSKDRKMPSLMESTVALSMFSFIFLAKFLSFAPVFFWLSIMACAALLIFLVKRNRYFQTIVPLVIILINGLLFFSPAHKKYYWLNVRFNHEIEHDAYTWDKYALFLRQNGEVEQALAASNQVEQILRNAGDSNTVEMSKQHAQKRTIGN